MVPPPRDIDDLLDRARRLIGVRVDAIAAALGTIAGGAPVRTKGAAGAILERALGATGGPGRFHDFPELRVELKTIPVTPDGLPIESTYVCTLPLGDADEQEWATSWAREKLERVLFVPLVGDDGIPWPSRVVGPPLLWSPTLDQERILRDDFEDIVGLVGIGRIEDLDARRGRWLQARPKARDGSARTVVFGIDGDPIEVMPRGLYLRARFTRALLGDATAVPA